MGHLSITLAKKKKKQKKQKNEKKITLKPARWFHYLDVLKIACYILFCCFN